MLLLLLAMGPLFVAAVGEVSPLRVSSALEALFCLLYVGIGFVAVWIGGTMRRRAALLKTKANAANRVPAMLSI